MYFIFLLNSFFRIIFVTDLFQSFLAHTLVMIVKKGAAPTAETNCVMRTEYVMSVLIITMEYLVFQHALIIVSMVAIEVESVIAVRLVTRGMIAVTDAQSSVMVSVIETQVIVTASLDTGGMNVTRIVHKTVQMMTVTKQQVTAQVAKLCIGETSVIGTVQLTVQMINVTKQQVTAQIAKLCIGETNVIGTVQLTVQMRTVTKILETVLEDVRETATMDQNVRSSAHVMTSVMKMENVSVEMLNRAHLQVDIQHA